MTYTSSGLLTYYGRYAGFYYCSPHSVHRVFCRFFPLPIKEKILTQLIICSTLYLRLLYKQLNRTDILYPSLILRDNLGSCFSHFPTAVMLLENYFRNFISLASTLTKTVLEFSVSIFKT